MQVPKRHKVDKTKSAGEFRRNVGKTKAANVQPRSGTVQQGPARGGIRL